MAPVEFLQNPPRYMAWAARAKPALFWAMAIGCAGPVIVLVAPPIRRYFGDTVGRPQIPLTYPIPKGPRNPPSGYDD